VEAGLIVWTLTPIRYTRYPPPFDETDQTDQNGPSSSLATHFNALTYKKTVMYPYIKEVRIMLAKNTSKNQLTLPKEIVKDFPGIDYFDVAVKEGRIILVPVMITPVDASLGEIRKKVQSLGISGRDVKTAVKWARKRKK
jgi:hypothetical protein